MEDQNISKRMNKDDRRKQILKRAIPIFVEKGFKGTTTLELAKAADITEVTLFRYFSSKKDIFLQGIQPIIFSTLAVSSDSMERTSAKDKLEHVLYERISLVSNNFEIVKLILAEKSLLDELGSENYITKVHQILEDMFDKIGIRLDDKEFTLRLLMGSILSFLYLPERNEADTKKYVSKIAKLLLGQNNK